MVTVSCSTTVGIVAPGGGIQCMQMEEAWKAELRKGKPIIMYSMVSVNISSQDQLSSKLVVQCKTPLVYIPESNTGIASLLTNTNAGHTKNARIIMVWGPRQGIFCPVGACVRATRHVAANAVLALG